MGSRVCGAGLPCSPRLRRPPLPVPTRVGGLGGGARSLAENGRCARSPRPPPPSAAPGTALERLQPRARPTHAPTRRLRVRVRVCGRKLGPGPRAAAAAASASLSAPEGNPRASSVFSYHFLNIDPQGQAGSRGFCFDLLRRWRCLEKGSTGGAAGHPYSRCSTAAVHRRERGSRTGRDSASPPPAGRPAQAVTTLKGQPACPSCSHTPRGPLPSLSFSPATRRASLGLLSHYHHPAWVTPVRLAVLAPSVVTPEGWVGGVGSETEPLQNFSPFSKVCLGGTGGVAWGGAPPRIPSEGTGGVAIDLAS